MNRSILSNANCLNLQNVNKTGTFKVGAISKAQKAQITSLGTIFFERDFVLFSFEKCRIVPKNVKGGTLFDL